MCYNDGLGDVLFRWVLHLENCIAGHDLYSRYIVRLNIDARNSASTVGNAAFGVKKLVDEFTGTVAGVVGAVGVTPRFAVAG